jgi:hypothetical protein
MARTTPMAGLGVAEPPLWALGVVQSPPNYKIRMVKTTPKGLGVARSLPFGLGVGSAAPKSQTLNLFFFIWHCGNDQTTPMGYWVVQPLPNRSAGLRWPNPPPSQMMIVLATHILLFGVASWTTPRAMGVVQPPPNQPWGGSTIPLAKIATPSFFF